MSLSHFSFWMVRFEPLSLLMSCKYVCVVEVMGLADKVKGKLKGMVTPVEGQQVTTDQPNNELVEMQPYEPALLTTPFIAPPPTYEAKVGEPIKINGVPQIGEPVLLLGKVGRRIKALKAEVSTVYSHERVDVHIKGKAHPTQIFIYLKEPVKKVVLTFDVHVRERKNHDYSLHSS